MGEYADLVKQIEIALRGVAENIRIDANMLNEIIISTGVFRVEGTEKITQDPKVGCHCYECRPDISRAYWPEDQRWMTHREPK